MSVSESAAMLHSAANTFTENAVGLTTGASDFISNAIAALQQARQVAAESATAAGAALGSEHPAFGEIHVSAAVYSNTAADVQGRLDDAIQAIIDLDQAGHRHAGRMGGVAQALLHGRA